MTSNGYMSFNSNSNQYLRVATPYSNAHTFTFCSWIRRLRLNQNEAVLGMGLLSTNNQQGAMVLFQKDNSLAFSVMKTQIPATNASFATDVLVWHSMYAFLRVFVGFMSL